MTKKRYPKLKQCHNVKQLIEELQKLPPVMPVAMPSEDGLILVPVNVGHYDEHVNISTGFDCSWDEDSFIAREADE
jgi:hypothetical protein